MGDQPNKVERALGAMREEGWSDLQHRRVAKRIEDALEAPASNRHARLWILAAAACVIGVVVALRPWHRPMVATTGTTLGSEAEVTSAVLADGSAVEVGRGGRVEVVADRADETRIEVTAGRAEFEVQKRPGRPFITSVRGVEVRVIGTRFSTELDMSHPPGLVRVLVRRGVVEVRRPGEEAPSRLMAGDSLEVPLALPADPAAPTPAVESAPPVAPAPSGKVSVAAPPPVDAAKLFETAKAARSAGDVEGAIRSYAALLKEFPNDKRVGVAALELGRLRMDAQHAYGPAAEAFRRALAAAPNEGVREDALARLIEALDAMSDRAQCLKERSRYQQQYPKGVHAESVQNRCGR
jgi:TolA-binding protein